MEKYDVFVEVRKVHKVTIEAENAYDARMRAGELPIEEVDAGEVASDTYYKSYMFVRGLRTVKSEA